MSRWDDQQRDAGRLRQRLDQVDRERTRDAQVDIVIDGPRRLLLRAPGGDFFAISVTDGGALVATNLGPNAL